MEHKKPISWRILEILGESTMTATDLAIAIIKSGHGAPQSRIRNAAAEQAVKRAKNTAEQAKRHAYNSLIYKLKKEGLIISGNSGLSLTANGRAKLKNIHEKKKFPPIKYEKNDTSNFIIFSYDIAGKKFQERHWLRSALLGLGLQPIQQSVWIGKVHLPEEFLSDMEYLDLLKYTEIFEITKKGTLREI